MRETHVCLESVGLLPPQVVSQCTCDWKGRRWKSFQTAGKVSAENPETARRIPKEEGGFYTRRAKSHVRQGARASASQLYNLPSPLAELSTEKG